MQRHAFGTLALLFLVTGLYYQFFDAEKIHPLIIGATIRIGCVLGALWLAYPDLKNVPRWFYPVLLTAVAIVMICPKLIILVAPTVIAIWILSLPYGEYSIESSVPTNL